MNSMDNEAQEGLKKYFRGVSNLPRILEATKLKYA
jgi:hypothetical protein